MELKGTTTMELIHAVSILKCLNKKNWIQLIHHH